MSKKLISILEEIERLECANFSISELQPFPKFKTLEKVENLRLRLRPKTTYSRLLPALSCKPPTYRGFQKYLSRCTNP